MSDATVFSRSRQVVFENPLTRAEVEGLLQKFLNAVGEPLSHSGIILGHIKVLARLPGRDDFLFLSLTRLDRVDMKASPDWSGPECANIESIELTINVLVFGYSIGTVEKVVEASLSKAGIAPRNV